MKRKRDGEEDDLASPPRKIGTASPNSASQPRRVLGPSMPPQPAKNEEEIDVDDSDSDEAGSALPPSVGPARPSGPMRPTSPKARTAGPTMPPASNNEEIALNDSDSDDMGPAPPQKGSAAPPPAAAQPRRVMGPAPPPAPLDQMPSQPTNDSDSDDDDYGPSLPPAPGSAAAYVYETEKAQEREVERKEAAQPNKLQRADWMLVPPSDSDWGSRLDPTKLKNRKFASGKSEKAPTGGISAIWTETPEQKRQRLEDEVLGRKDAATAGARREHPRDDGEQEAIARRIRQYNEANRGKSLVEQHMSKEGVKEKEDDPSKRAFDHEKDMALGGLMTGAKKRDMLNKAGDFGSRFERGKFL